MKQIKENKKQKHKHNGARKASRSFFSIERLLSTQKEKVRAQTAVEYLLILASAIVFITVAAYYIKNNVLTG